MAPPPDDLETGPFAHAGEGVGVLLLHGFTGTPLELRPLGDALAAAGYAVFAPRLPGHGTTEANLAEVSASEWLEAALNGFDRLLGSCDEVFVGGLSMGSLIAARVCAERPAAGLIALAPALEPNSLPLWLAGPASWVKFSIPNKREVVDHEVAPKWSYDNIPLRAVGALRQTIAEAVAALPKVSAPLLVLHGRRDEIVKASGVQRYFALADTGDKELSWLDNTGHFVPGDVERDEVARQIVAFIEKRRAN